MTNSQKEKIEILKSNFFKFHCFGDENNYEIKRCDIDDEFSKSFVSMVIVVGMKNDEGTYAEIIARDRAHYFIGKRGAVSIPKNSSKQQKKTLKILGF